LKVELVSLPVIFSRTTLILRGVYPERSEGLRMTALNMSP
jgi:hypothetical protein